MAMVAATPLFVLYRAVSHSGPALPQDDNDVSAQALHRGVPCDGTPADRLDPPLRRQSAWFLWPAKWFLRQRIHADMLWTGVTEMLEYLYYSGAIIDVRTPVQQGLLQKGKSPFD